MSAPRRDRLHQHRRFAAGGNGNDERDPRDVEIERLRERVRELEIQHEIRQIRKRIRELELTGNEEHPPNGDIIYDYPPAYDEYEDEEWYSWMTGAGVTYDPTGVKIQDSLQGGQAVDFVDLDFIDSAEHLIEKKYGDGPTVVTGGPVASMATLPFVPEVQRRKGDEASNWVMEPHANNDTVDLGLYVKNDFFNKIGLVDCGPQDQMGRKDYEGPTTTSLDVLKSLSSKIATTKCVGAELFERFNLIANSDRFNAPYDPGGTGLVPGETTREVKLFRRMSSKNGVNPPALNPSTNSNFTLLSVLGRERLTGPNYMDWMRNHRFTLRYENKEYVLDEQIPTINDDSTQEEIEAHQKHYDDANKVSCIMTSSMSHELQKTFENTWAYEMNQLLKEMF
ncbi:hypothetical protein Tco_0855454 [Tanacetum coccineum]